MLNGFKKDKAVLNDPARGRVEVSLEEFDESFTGVVLCFEKTEAFVPSGKPRSVWEFAKNRLRGTGTAFAFVVLTGLLITGIGLVLPMFSRIFMDRILGGKNPEWLGLLLGALAVTLVFQFLVSAIQALYWLKIEGSWPLKLMLRLCGMSYASVGFLCSVPLVMLLPARLVMKGSWLP